MTQQTSLWFSPSFGLATTLAGLSLSLIYTFISLPTRRRKKVEGDLTKLIGQTPILRINSLSQITGCEIWGKCEFLNPGGSVKDRVALKIIREAERQGSISPHASPKWKIFEGTSGSTGISLALVARALGYETEIVLPDDTAHEKIELIEKMGGTVIKVRPVSIVHASHYVNLARQRALDYKPTDESGQTVSRGFFLNQFDNLINSQAHYESTGPEIWEQTGGQIDVFVSGAGTGGTMAGVGSYLRYQKPELDIILADPLGSGLFHKVKEGVMYSSTEAEGKRRRHQVDTIVEGIGLNRSTQNFEKALPQINDAIQVTDQEAIKMSRYLVIHDGLFIGSSAAVNLVACVKLAKRSNSKLKIVTILCDGGQRHLSKFWNDDYLKRIGIDTIVEDDFNLLEYL
ncbi:hypothetical protein CROQUDRAFT_672193 [Cronartium quercuum f. sp. fusiforme G11]|uniref:cysteine synthase n=1 Tax=Cronartium quercuum f. sp. fusiforme G11 TaxID=708437 RepID=A0A9P6NF32_9BASI|nr:hypothetical protein CROQUDRAFT_672193 [Cronartium quercuum f. sp. fusiforme G11]